MRKRRDGEERRKAALALIFTLQSRLKSHWVFCLLFFSLRLRKIDGSKSFVCHLLFCFYSPFLNSACALNNTSWARVELHELRTVKRLGLAFVSRCRLSCLQIANRLIIMFWFTVTTSCYALMWCKHEWVFCLFEFVELNIKALKNCNAMQCQLCQHHTCI